MSVPPTNLPLNSQDRPEEWLEVRQQHLHHLDHQKALEELREDDLSESLTTTMEEEDLGLSIGREKK